MTAHARLAALATMSALTTLAPRAYGQPVLHEEGSSVRSDKSWGLEVRFGPYSPDIDSEFSGPVENRPYRLYFGSKRRVLSQLELDYQFFRGFGSAAVGVQVGYLRASAQALAEATNEPTADPTTLTLLPLGLTMVYRMDVPALRWQIPLVPYVKLGLGYTIWTITNGNGDVAHSTLGGRGRGGTAGWQAAAGLAFMLDVLDSGAARALDSETGINHTYLFFEGAHFATSGLGRKNALHVGDTTWLLGLLFEF
jgi:hypothetical protein